MEIDVRQVLPAIHTPTVVLHRTGDRVVDIGAGRFLAEQIPGARFVELPGEDHSPFTGGFEPLVQATEQFLREVRSERAWEESEPPVCWRRSSSRISSARPPRPPSSAMPAGASCSARTTR